MKISKALIIIMILLSLPVLFSGCGGDDNEPEQLNNNVDWKELSLSQQSLTLNAGEAVSVAIISGNGRYSATSSSESIATVAVISNSITVNGVSEGNATITLKDMSEKSCTLNVSVLQDDSADNLDLLISVNEVEMLVGTVQYVPIISGSGGYQAISMDENVVKASISGGNVLLKSVSEGSTTVKVTDQSNGNAEIAVKVKSEDDDGDGYFDHCESLMGWSGAGLTLDTLDHTEGKYCLKAVIDGNVEYFIRSLTNPVNSLVCLENGYLHFDLYVSDVSQLNLGQGDEEIEISSSTNDQNELHWRMASLNLENGMNNVDLKLSEGTKTGGEIDLTSVRWFRIYNTKIGTLTMKIDNIYFHE